MKNLSKALALLVVVAMTLTTVAFASAFTDVKDDAANAEAINVGAALGLFKGYDDGTFKPEGSITRAEFAAIVVRLRGQESAAAGAATETAFNDVPADHWAAGYINIATRLGIINGYGDGNFGPDDPVLYEQAVKMVVVALGYEPLVGQAGYPVGYLTEAASIGLTAGVNGQNGVAANRGIVAQIIYNALDTPLLKQTGFGAFLNYEVQDGNGDTEKETVLSEYLGIVKVQATVDSSSVMDKNTTKEETVKVTITNNFKSKYGQVASDEFEVGDQPTLAAGKSGISDLVGTKAMIYVAYDENSSEDPEVLYCSKDVSKSYEATIKSSQIENVVDKTDYVLVEYRENPSDRSVQSYKIDFDTSKNDDNGSIVTKLYVNGVAQDITSIDDIISAIDANNDAFYGDIVLSNNDANYDYNTIFVTDYKTIVVDENNTRTNKITALNDEDTLQYANSTNTIKATLYGPDNKEMSWADLQPNDVVTYTIADGDVTDVITGWKLDTAITGTLNSMNSSNDEETVTIDGKEYDLNDRYMTTADVSLGDSGTYYLDKLGNIVYADTTASVSSNYAYVIQAGAYDDGFDNVMQLKLFTKDGTVKPYDVAERVKIDGISFESKKMVDADGKHLQDATVNYKTSLDALKKQQGTSSEQFTYNAAGDEILDVKAIKAGDLVTFNENSAGEITTIDRPYSVNNTTDGKNKFTQFKGEFATTMFNSGSDASITAGGSKYYVTDNTVIMLAPGTTTEEDYELVSVASIADEQPINNVSFFNVNEDKEVGCVIIGDINFSGEGDTHTFVIANDAKGQTTNADGDVVDVIKGMRDGDVLAEDLVTTTDATNIDDVEIGSAFFPMLNGKGEVKSVKVLATPDDDNNDVTIGAATIAANGVTNGKSHYYYGKVEGINKKTVTYVDPTTNELVDVTVPNGSNFYIYDERESSNSRKVSEDGDLSDVEATYNDKGTADAADDTVNYVDNIGLDGAIHNVYIFAHEYDGDIVDVTLYIFN